MTPRRPACLPSPRDSRLSPISYSAADDNLPARSPARPRKKARARALSMAPPLPESSVTCPASPALPQNIRAPSQKRNSARAQPQTPLRIARFRQPLQSRAKIIVLQRKSLHPFRSLRAALLRRLFFREYQAISRVRALRVNLSSRSPAVSRSSYSRIVSSITNRDSPFACSTRCIKLLSTSDSMPSSKSRSRSPFVSHTASTPSSVHPPANTANLRKSFCSAALSRS